MLKTISALLFTVIGLSVGGCCTARRHAAAKWEYKTLVVPNDAVPLGQATESTPVHGSRPRGASDEGWISNDAVLNSVIDEGWVVAGYGVDHINSQWFLLKRQKR
jgi:hypothetical protein